MHGRVKVRTTAEQQEIKRKEREKKVKLYRAGINKVLEKRSNDEYDEEMLEIIGQLLTANPDIYTLWNIRRETLLHFKKHRLEDQMKQIMELELRLTEQSLHTNPKSYGAWHHRTWVLDNMEEPNWERELNLCNKYLDMDERNFHTWDYRRFVVCRAKVPASKELDYTTRKITTNFSNYSSWHYRSRLLPLLYADPRNMRPIREDKHKEELELVQNAAFTDPNDQSAWFYQRWLLGHAKQSLKVYQALISHKLSLITLNKKVSLNETQLDVIVNGNVIDGSWHSSNGKPYSYVWIFSPTSSFFPNNETFPEIVVQVTSKLMEPGPVESLTVILQCRRDVAWTNHLNPFDPEFSTGIISVLEQELESCIQLLELEPDSKWTILTSVLLMQAIDRHKYKDKTMEKINQLIELDTLRAGYYKDLRSRYQLEYAIDIHHEASEAEPLKNVNLSNCQLTALYHTHCLSLYENIDLTGNHLGFSLSKLHALQNCQVLKLDKNGIQSLAELPSLPNLTDLSLRDNKITSTEVLKNLTHCPKLCCLDLSGNGIEIDEEFIKLAREAVPQLKKLNGKLLT